MTRKKSMRVVDDEVYYRDNSAALGWGVEEARLDPERVELLKRYVVGPKVLDVACGSGIYTDYLASQGYDAWGVDLVSDFIEKAKAAKKGNYLQVQADRLPFADGEFDTVLLFDILEHVDDVAVLTEAKRVALKRILVNVPRSADMELQEVGIVFRHYIDKTHLREYHDNDIVALAGDVDLKLREIVPVNYIDPSAIYRSLFKGNAIVLRTLKILCNLLLGKKKFPTGYFTVFDVS